MTPATPAPAGFTRVVVVEATGSTNDDLLAARAADPAAWPHLSALLAREQRAGHGRLGRTWTTPPGQALTLSVVIEPGPRPAAQWPTLSLVAGLAAARACARLAPSLVVRLKWPNDVVVVTSEENDDDAPGWSGVRKLGGVLAQASDSVVVLGIGINVAQTHLPVPWATSLALATAGVPGPVPAGVDEVAAALGAELAPLVERWRDGGFAAVRADVVARTDTLGRDVRVEFADGSGVTGRADGLDPDGRLVVRDAAGDLHIVAAGDVRHLRGWTNSAVAGTGD